MPDPIKPTAADREAAWHYAPTCIRDDPNPGAYDRWISGLYDNQRILQAFALHARQAREQALESLPDEIDLFRLLRRAGRKDIDKARAVDAAIRALKDQPPC